MKRAKLIETLDKMSQQLYEILEEQSEEDKITGENCKITWGEFKMLHEAYKKLHGAVVTMRTIEESRPF